MRLTETIVLCFAIACFAYYKAEVKKEEIKQESQQQEYRNKWGVGMDIKQIRKNAPSGATHYDDNGNYYRYNYPYLEIYSWGWLTVSHSSKIKPL